MVAAPVLVPMILLKIVHIQPQHIGRLLKPYSEANAPRYTSLKKNYGRDRAIVAAAAVVAVQQVAEQTIANLISSKGWSAGHPRHTPSRTLRQHHRRPT